MLGTILVVILILALVGALPRWSHSRNWGYYPTGGVGLVLLIIVILLVLGLWIPAGLNTVIMHSMAAIR